MARALARFARAQALEPFFGAIFSLAIVFLSDLFLGQVGQEESDGSEQRDPQGSDGPVLPPVCQDQVDWGGACRR